MSEPTLLPVRVERPETMNLLGLLLRGILERRLARPPVPRLRGDVHVEAGGMRITLRFRDDAIVLSREPSPRPRAIVRGTMRALVDAALGRGRVRAWLAGRLRVRGGLLTLIRLLRLLRV